MGYKVGVVGCGRIASTFDDDPLRDRPWTHAGAYDAINDTTIVAASDMNSEMLNTFGKRWNVSALYNDYQEMLKKENLDIVSVCTPTGSHCDIVKTAAEAHVKAIFCEKPMAMNLVECDLMIDICKKNNVILSINHTRRWDKSYCFPYELLQKGEIGEILSMVMYCPNTLAESGSHAFDLISWYGGEADWICARGDTPEMCKDSRSKTDPGASGFISFKNGVSGYFVGSSTKDYIIFELDVIGTNGRIRIVDNGFNLEIYKSAKSKHYGEYNDLQRVETPYFEKPNRMIAAVTELVECIKTNKVPVSGGVQGMRALEIISAFRLSAKKGGEKINLPLLNDDREINIL